MRVHVILQKIILILLLVVTTANGKSFIQRVKVYQKDETLFTDVSARIDFPKSVKEAINSGLTLTFSYEFKINQPKWYRFGPIAKIKKNYQISYHRITDEYRLSNPVTFERRTFNSFYELQKALQNLRAFPLILTTQLDDKPAVLSVRFHLSDDNLPTYARVDRVFNDNWSVDSDWKKRDIP